MLVDESTVDAVVKVVVVSVLVVVVAGFVLVVVVVVMAWFVVHSLHLITHNHTCNWSFCWFEEHWCIEVTPSCHQSHIPICCRFYHHKPDSFFVSWFKVQCSMMFKVSSFSSVLGLSTTCCLPIMLRVIVQRRSVWLMFAARICAWNAVDCPNKCVFP